MRQIRHYLRNGALDIGEVPLPALGAGDVLVRTHYSFVSMGTEKMKLSQARMSLMEKARKRPDEIGDLQLRLPPRTANSDMRLEVVAGDGTVLAQSETRLSIATLPPVVATVDHPMLDAVQTTPTNTAALEQIAVAQAEEIAPLADTPPPPAPRVARSPPRPTRAARRVATPGGAAQSRRADRGGGSPRHRPVPPHARWHFPTAARCPARGARPALPWRPARCRRCVCGPARHAPPRSAWPVRTSHRHDRAAADSGG